MKTVEEWSLYLRAKHHYGKSLMPGGEPDITDMVWPDDIRAIQADCFRFASMHFESAFDINEASMKLSEIADALERGDDITEMIKPPEVKPEKANKPMP